jgi:hypothetical protein
MTSGISGMNRALRWQRWLRRGFGALLSAAFGVAVHGAAGVEPVQGPLHEAGMVGYLQQQTLGYRPFERWPGVRVKTLSEDRATGRLAVYAEFRHGWAGKSLPAAAQSIDIVILDGSLAFGAETLGSRDFAFVPPGVAPAPLTARARTHALLFFDPPSPDAAAVAKQREHGAYITRFDPTRWEVAALAKSAGSKIDLRIMNLKNDPYTTARTWYVTLSGGMQTPWEVHSMTEEGYLLQGGYTLAECLGGRTVVGDYVPGGYFWRPGGIPHSGPDSAPHGEVIWLQRSPIALDVVFYEDCRDGKALRPLLR